MHMCMCPTCATLASQLALLDSTLSAHPTEHVIACGGGIVETEAGRALLRAHWPVVQAIKPIEDIEAYLASDSSRPSLGEHHTIHH